MMKISVNHALDETTSEKIIQDDFEYPLLSSIKGRSVLSLRPPTNFQKGCVLIPRITCRDFHPSINKLIVIAILSCNFRNVHVYSNDVNCGVKK
jgi:hypothetical protein